MMWRKLLMSFAIACVLFSTNLLAQDTIFYSARFSNAVHHEAEVSITYENVQTPFLRLALSNYSPGRYANHEFGKNVYGVKAFSAADEPLKVTKVKPNEWLVEVVDGYVKVNYTLFANYADGTYSRIDRQFIHLNIPSAFIWALGTENKPVRLSLHFPPGSGWKVATQLKEHKENEIYAAPDFRYFIDSPLMIGNIAVKKIYDDEASILLCLNPAVVDSVAEEYKQMIGKIVLEQKGIFGEFPNYEFGEYKFLCGYGHGFRSDGMEHRNSTVITSGISLAGNENKLIGTVAHEFFHCWNVERLRPKSLEPFDLLNPAISGELWFAEGITTYYTSLTLRRAGIINDSLFIAQLSSLLNYVILSPGTGKYSPVEMSAMATFVDASSFNDPTNFHNNFTSYYVSGAILGLALDLEMRSKFDLSLDDYMKSLWEKFGKTELPYTNEDLKNELASFTGDAVFANAFFDQYIYGTNLPDFEGLLLNAGFLIMRDNKKTDLSGFKYEFSGGAIIFKSKPRERSTLYVAGIDEYDSILSINGKRFNSLEDFNEYIAQFTPGQSLKITYAHLGQKYEAITLAKPDLSITVSDMEVTSPETVTASQQKVRQEWLSSKASD